MALEAERNLPSVRVGRGAEYDEKAKFVLKILPDMDRNKAEFEQRIDAAKRGAQPRGQLTRRKFEEPGTAGYLYLQASALVSGLGALPRDRSAVSLSDLDFENPSDLKGPKVGEAGDVQMSVQVPQKPSSSGRLLERMGTALIAGFAAAFACEVGMKAILMTRLDGFEMTHDLMKLFESLPEDCRERLQGDFTGIVEILGKYRHVFDKTGRYFEPGTDQDAFLALVDTDRIWGLGKAARPDDLDEGQGGSRRPRIGDPLGCDPVELIEFTEQETRKVLEQGYLRRFPAFVASRAIQTLEGYPRFTSVLDQGEPTESVLARRKKW